MNRARLIFDKTSVGYSYSGSGPPFLFKRSLPVPKPLHWLCSKRHCVALNYGCSSDVSEICNVSTLKYCVSPYISRDHD